ncbi:MAG: zinc metalloprotease HtpX [SAR202 cluster bacterium]|nr:zinc metalloprotease HtpX [SAR202 cluster bacterium]
MAVVRRDFGGEGQLRLRMAVTMLLLGVVYGFFLWAIFALTGGSMAWALVAVTVMVLIQFALSDRMILYSMRAKVVTPAEEPRLHAMVERLAVAAGIPKPRVAVSELDIPNAFAAGRSQKTAVVCATRRLMRILSERELEGVMAHELAHVKNRDAMVMTFASFFSVVASTLMSWFFWMGLFGGSRRDSRDSSGSALMIAYLVTMVVWFVSQLLILALSRYREYAADRGAAATTGRPIDLASALLTLDATMRGVPKEDLRKAEAMNAFFIMPAIGDAMAEAFSSHPPIMKRVERLKAMQAQIGSI